MSKTGKFNKTHETKKMQNIKRIKELHLKINIDDINSEIINNLEKDLKNSKKGNCHLKITIVANNNGKTLSLDMISREKKISIDDNFLKSIENNSSIEYFISK